MSGRLILGSRRRACVLCFGLSTPACPAMRSGSSAQDVPSKNIKGAFAAFILPDAAPCSLGTSTWLHRALSWNHPVTPNLINLLIHAPLLKDAIIGLPFYTEDWIYSRAWWLCSTVIFAKATLTWELYDGFWLHIIAKGFTQHQEFGLQQYIYL